MQATVIIILTSLLPLFTIIISYKINMFESPIVKGVIWVFPAARDQKGKLLKKKKKRMLSNDILSFLYLYLEI